MQTIRTPRWWVLVWGGEGNRRELNRHNHYGYVMARPDEAGRGRAAPGWGRRGGTPGPGPGLGHRKYEKKCSLVTLSATPKNVKNMCVKVRKNVQKMCLRIFCAYLCPSGVPTQFTCFCRVMTHTELTPLYGQSTRNGNTQAKRCGLTPNYEHAHLCDQNLNKI